MPDEGTGAKRRKKTKAESFVNDQKEKFKAMHQTKQIILQGILTQKQMTRLDKIHQYKHSMTGEGGGSSVSPLSFFIEHNYI